VTARAGAARPEPSPEGDAAVLLATIERLRWRLTAARADAAEVAAAVDGRLHDDGAPLPITVTPTSPVLKDAAVVRTWGGEEAASVTLRLADTVAVQLGVLEALAGPARRLRTRATAEETVVLPALPGPPGATHECGLLATLRPDGVDDPDQEQGPSGRPGRTPVDATPVDATRPAPSCLLAAVTLRRDRRLA